jgi:hypothetical protein
MVEHAEEIFSPPLPPSPSSDWQGRRAKATRQEEGGRRDGGAVSPGMQRLGSSLAWRIERKRSTGRSSRGQSAAARMGDSDSDFDHLSVWGSKEGGKGDAGGFAPARRHVSGELAAGILHLAAWAWYRHRRRLDHALLEMKRQAGLQQRQGEEGEGGCGGRWGGVDKRRERQETGRQRDEYQASNISVKSFGASRSKEVVAYMGIPSSLSRCARIARQSLAVNQHTEGHERAGDTSSFDLTLKNACPHRLQVTERGGAMPILRLAPTFGPLPAGLFLKWPMSNSVSPF